MSSLFGSLSRPGFGAAASSSTTVAANADPPDLEVANPPTDSISCLSWSPVADFLAVGSWDNQVRVYELKGSTTEGRAQYTHEAPVLSVCWNKEGNKILSGGADKAGRMYDVSTGQSSQIAQHDQPISHIKWVDMQNGICATGSWDKTIKYWDLRQSQPVATLQMPDRVYAMDVQGPLLVAGTAERHICVVDLNNPTTIFKQLQSPLKMQTRCISAFPDQKGYAVGSIEGRVAIQYIEDEKNNFSFKCHRKDAGPGNNIPKMQSLIWPVNAISFHQQQGTFSTAGADGTIYIWDKDSRTRLKTFDNRGGPIVATGFNHTGMVFAYAIAYDWHQGHAQNLPTVPNKIMLHACKEEEVKKRPKK